MKTNEMIEVLRNGQVAFSNSSKIQVCKTVDIGIAVKSHSVCLKGLKVGQPLPLSESVLSISDWVVSIQEFDFNKIFESIMTEEDGVTSLYQDSVYHFDKYCLLEYISLNHIINSKWFVGKYHRKDLILGGYIDAE